MRAADYEKEWNERAAKALVGRTIKSASYLTKKEASDLGWPNRSLVIELDNGVTIFPSRDDEGNGAGALFTTIDGLETIPVIPA